MKHGNRLILTNWRTGMRAGFDVIAPDFTFTRFMWQHCAILTGLGSFLALVLYFAFGGR